MVPQENALGRRLVNQISPSATLGRKADTPLDSVPHSVFPLLDHGRLMLPCPLARLAIWGGGMLLPRRLRSSHSATASTEAGDGEYAHVYMLARLSVERHRCGGSLRRGSSWGWLHYKHPDALLDGEGTSASSLVYPLYNVLFPCI